MSTFIQAMIHYCGVWHDRMRNSMRNTDRTKTGLNSIFGLSIKLWWSGWKDLPACLIFLSHPSCCFWPSTLHICCHYTMIKNRPYNLKLLLQGKLEDRSPTFLSLLYNNIIHHDMPKRCDIFITATRSLFSLATASTLGWTDLFVEGLWESGPVSGRIENDVVSLCKSAGKAGNLVDLLMLYG